MRVSPMRLTSIFSCFVVTFAGDDLWNTIGGSDCSTKSVQDCASTDECTVQSGACGCKYEQVVEDVCYGGFASYIWYADSQNTAAIVSGYVVPSSASMVTRSPMSSCYLDTHDHQGGSGGTYKMHSCSGKIDGDQPDYSKYTDSNCQNVDGSPSPAHKSVRCVSDGTRPSKVGKNGVTSLCMWDGCSSAACNANEQTCASGHLEDSSVYPCKYNAGACSCDTAVSQFRKSVCYSGVATYLYFNTASDCSANQNSVDAVTMDNIDECNSDGHSWTAGGTSVAGTFRRTTCSGVANYGAIQWHHYTSATCPAAGTTPAMSRPATDAKYTEDCTCVPKYAAPTPAPPITGAPATLRKSFYSSTSCGGAPTSSVDMIADGSCIKATKYNPSTGLLENDKWMKLQMSCESTGSQNGKYRYSHQAFSDSACTSSDDSLGYGELDMGCESESEDGINFGKKYELICGTAATYTTTTIAAATTIAVAQDALVSGEMQLTVPDTFDCSRSDSELAVGQGLAVFLSVPVSRIDATLARLNGSRRLGGSMLASMDRRLATIAVQANYTVTIPPGSNYTAASITNSISTASTSQMTTAIQAQMAAVYGANFIISVTSISAPTTTYSATTTDSSGLIAEAFGLSLNPILPFLFCVLRLSIR